MAIKSEAVMDLLGDKAALSFGLTVLVMFSHLVDDHGMTRREAAEALDTTEEMLSTFAQHFADATGYEKGETHGDQ